MAYTPHVWVPRLGSNLNRFTKANETSTSVDLTNAPEIVTQAGTPFSTDIMNEMEEGIADANAGIGLLATCDTAAATQIKEINLSDYTIKAGMHIDIDFTYGNTVGSVEDGGIASGANIVTKGAGEQIRIVGKNGTFLFNEKIGGEYAGSGCHNAGDCQEFVITTMATGNTSETAGVIKNKDANETQLAKFYPYLYTGRNLVEVFGVSTAVQAFAKLKAKSDAGGFSGLGIGDYIDIPSIVIDGTTINYNSTYQNLRAEIVAFDQYYRNGDTDITYHHIIMQMKNCPLKHRMNASNDNTGGWASSELKTYLSNTVAGAIENAIGISLKTIRRILSTHSSWAWLAEKCFLPSEVECIGTKAWSDNYGYTVGNHRQWAMFHLRPDRLIKFYNGARQWWWTCSDSTSGSANFVLVHDSGYVTSGSASIDGGVPFAFAI